MKQAPPLDDKKATACSATCRARPCNEQTLQDGSIKRAPQNRFCIFTRHGETVEKNLYVHIQIQNFRSPLPTSKTPFLCSEKEDSGPRNYSSRRLSVLSNIVFTQLSFRKSWYIRFFPCVQTTKTRCMGNRWTSTKKVHGSCSISQWFRHHLLARARILPSSLALDEREHAVTAFFLIDLRMHVVHQQRCTVVVCPTAAGATWQGPTARTASARGVET